jgi:thioredoxin 1
MSDYVVALSDKDFFSTMKSCSFMVTDFWATWCPPCRMMAPIIDELSQKYAGRVMFAKMDVDANPVTSQQFGIRSIPTFLMTDKGKVLDVLIGAMPKERFESEIVRYLSRN